MADEQETAVDETVTEPEAVTEKPSRQPTTHGDPKAEAQALLSKGVRTKRGVNEALRLLGELSR